MWFKHIKKTFNLIKSSQVFCKFLWSHIFTGIIIILLLGSFLFKTFIPVYRNEIEYSKIQAMNVIKNTIDGQIKTLEQLASQIGNNAQFSSFNISGGQYNLYHAVKRLNDYKTSYSFISDIILFYDKDNEHDMRILTDNGFNDINELFSKAYDFKGYNSEEIINQIREIRVPTILSFREVFINGVRRTDFALYVFPTPINAVHPSNGIIFFIEQNNFDNMVKDVLSENGEFLLLNANEMIVYNKQNHSEDSFFDIAQILVRNKDSRESLHSETINGEKYLVVKVISEYYNWTYINFIPEKQYMHQISYIQNLFYIIIFAVLLVMIGLSYLSAYGNYRPLNEIVKQIVTSKDIELTESQKKSNEFSCIIQAFNELNKENQNLITRLREMIDTLKEFILIKIIKQGNLSSDELLEFKNTFGVNHIGKSFCVFSILFDMQEDKSEYIPYNKIRKKVIADIENFQEIDNVFTLFLTEDKGIAVLLIINKIDNNLIQKIAEQMRETIKYSFDFTATIGVGEICNSMQDINVSYKQSYEAAKYRLIRGGDTVINYSEFKELRVIGYETLIERCSELVSAIKNADRERVTEELDSIVQEIICHKHSIQTLQLISVNIFHKVIDMLNEAKIKPERNIIKPIEQVISMEIDSIEEFQKNVTEFCMGVCEKLDNKVSGKSAILKRSIEVYLKDNFRDADLSLTKIGDDLNMSPAYLTTFFKEQTGKSIMAYVEKLRIGQAKQLLRSTDLKIKDITRQVGFIDEGTFSRNFKKHEHITPTQYRSLMTEENTEAKMGKQH